MCVPCYIPLKPHHRSRLGMSRLYSDFQYLVTLCMCLKQLQYTNPVINYSSKAVLIIITNLIFLALSDPGEKNNQSSMMMFWHLLNCQLLAMLIHCNNDHLSNYRCRDLISMELYWSYLFTRVCRTQVNQQLLNITNFINNQHFTYISYKWVHCCR